MSIRWVILLFSIVMIVHVSKGKILALCEAVGELQSGGISRSMLTNWICLMQSESGLNTQLVTGPKTASSYSYGVFQINSLTWCTRGRVGGRCNARCEDFANDDIQDDIACAKKIYNTHGFNGWQGWVNKCKQKPLPNINHCLRRKRAVTPFDV